MEGKGWFVIYGVLALVVVYLFIAQQTLSGNVKQLQADVEQLRPVDAELEEETATDSPEPEASEAPDLSSATGRDEKRKADVIAINAALAEFKTKNGSYPKTLQELVPDFLTALPKDPLSPKYQYRYTKTATGFRLTCYIEQDDYPDDLNSDGKTDHILTITEKTR